MKNRNKWLFFLLICLALSMTCFVVLYFPAGKKPLIDRVAMEKDMHSVTGSFTGITWDPNTDTLVAVSNRQAQLFKLDINCRVLRMIILTDRINTESPSFLDGRFLIAEERQRRVTPVALSTDEEDYVTSGPELVFIQDEAISRTFCDVYLR